MSHHLIIAPIVLPLLVAALQLLIGERRRRTAGGAEHRLVPRAGGAGRACCCWPLRSRAATAAMTAVYRIGDWPARFGIVLVLDRLSALMVLLTAVLGWRCCRLRWAAGSIAAATSSRCSSSC